MPVDGNQAITALTSTELLDGYPDGNPLVVALRAELTSDPGMRDRLPNWSPWQPVTHEGMSTLMNWQVVVTGSYR